MRLKKEEHADPKTNFINLIICVEMTRGEKYLNIVKFAH